MNWHSACEFLTLFSAIGCIFLSAISAQCTVDGGKNSKIHARNSIIFAIMFLILGSLWFGLQA